MKKQFDRCNPTKQDKRHKIPHNIMESPLSLQTEVNVCGLEAVFFVVVGFEVFLCFGLLFIFFKASRLVFCQFQSHLTK